MQKSLALKRHVALVCHHQRSAQALGSKRNAVEKTKLVRPQLAGSIVEVLRGQAKVELDTAGRRLVGGLAEELPAGVAGEAVLGELGGGFVVGGGAKDLRVWRIRQNIFLIIFLCTQSQKIYSSLLGEQRNRTYREDQRNASAHSLCPIELRALTQPQLLIARSVLPAQHGSAKQKDLDALARGQNRRDARAAV